MLTLLKHSPDLSTVRHIGMMLWIVVNQIGKKTQYEYTSRELVIPSMIAIKEKETCLGGANGDSE